MTQDTAAPLHNALIYLIGFPGTGKATIGRALAAAMGPEARLIDSHQINGPLHEIVGSAGPRPVPRALLNDLDDARRRVRRVLLDTMVDLAPPGRSFILTNLLVEGNARDREAFATVRSAATARRAVFVPVRLHLDAAEHNARIATAERARALKLSDPEVGRRYRDGPGLLKVRHANLLDLDVTGLSPQEAAARILAHARGL
jgi:predicted kinase